MKTVLKQPEKNAQGDPGEKGWACYYCGKEGHLKQDCPQASKPPTAPCLVCKGPSWRRDWPLGCRPQGLDSQDNLDWRCLGVPTQALILNIPEETRVLITVGANQSIFLWTLGQLSLCSLVCFPPDPLPQWDCLDKPDAAISVFLQAEIGTLCYFLKFLIVPESPSPLLGRDILNKVQASVFINMKTALSLPLIEQNVNPKVRADGKPVSWVEHKILFLSLSNSKTLTYFHIKSSIH